MKALLKLLILFISSGAFAQSQDELPLAAVRYITSWGPQFDAFNPMIAVYKNGTVILKVEKDSSYCDMYCFSYYQYKLTAFTIDSIIHAFHINEAFDTLQRWYQPMEAQTGFGFSDAGTIVITVHDKTNRSVSILGGGWALNDSLYQFDPAPVKKLHDYLMGLRRRILESKQYTPWEPSYIELVRTPIFKYKELRDMYQFVPPTALDPKYEKRQWLSTKDRDTSDAWRTPLEYLQIRDETEKSHLMSILKNEAQVTFFRRKKYAIRYTFSYDHIPYYFNSKRQMEEM